jgi:hypothetical protein
VYYTSPITQVIQPGQGTVGTAQMASGVTVNFADGSVSAPSITNDGDTNTGIFFPAADTIAFAEGGSEVARFDSAGNLGIGTSSPAAKLGIQSSSDGSDSIRIRSAKGNAVDGLYGTIIFSSSTSSSFDVNGASISSGSFFIDAGDLRFSTSSGGSRIERGRFTEGGNFQFNSGYGSVATAYGCRAWVNFNGTGTVAIRASGNVSSITDNGTGNYTLNFTNALVDTSYSIAGFIRSDLVTPNNVHVLTAGLNDTKTTTALQVLSRFTSGLVDSVEVDVQIFR